MGWVGPAQPTGPDSAQNCWADLGPKMDWADFGPNTIILFWARPGLEDWAGPGPAWPSNKRWRGELFSPHPPACRTLFVLHAGKKTKGSNEGRKKNYLARRRLCVAGGAAAEAGGGVVAHGRRLQAALHLFRTSGGVIVFFPVFYPFPAFPFSSYVSVFSFSSLPSLLSVCFSFLCFFLCFSLLSVSLFFRFFLSLSSVFFVFSFSSVSPPLFSALGVLFIEPKAWLGTALMGSSRLVGHWRDCQGPAPLPGFLAGARWVVGHCVRSVGSRRESGRQKIQIKATLFPSSPLRDRGKKMNSVVQNDTVLLFLFFFFS